jgi:hypothetical protein
MVFTKFLLVPFQLDPRQPWRVQVSISSPRLSSIQRDTAHKVYLPLLEKILARMASLRRHSLLNMMKRILNTMSMVKFEWTIMEIR